MSIQYNEPNAFDINNPNWGIFSADIYLLGQKGTGATMTGPWVDTRAFKAMSMHVMGTFTGSVQLQGSNELQPLQATVNGTQNTTDANSANIGSAVSAQGITQITGVYRFVRAVATLSAGSVAAVLHGVN
jgi:hypothetical protein